jgi:hypothetical protein
VIELSEQHSEYSEPKNEFPVTHKFVLITIEGWSENSTERNYALLKEELEELPVRVIVPQYLDAKGFLARFRSHKTIEEYASIVEGVILSAKQEYPTAKIYVLGYSLGGIIARYLCNKGLFPVERMILAGTPNCGVNFGFFKNSILKVLARICNVPAFFQLLEGSEFIRTLNKNGFPKAHYISGEIDKTVPRHSSSPLGTGIIVLGCGHKLFPRKRELLESSAIPLIKGFFKMRGILE